MKKYLPKLISFLLICLMIFPKVVFADYVKYSLNRNSPQLIPSQTSENLQREALVKSSGMMEFNKDTSAIYSINKGAYKVEITPFSFNGANLEYSKNTVTGTLDIKKNVLSYIWGTPNEDFLFGEITSLDISETLGTIAMTIKSEENGKDGLAIFTDYKGKIIKVVRTGVQPGNITFSPNSKAVLISNSGKGISDSIENDPYGSITVVSINGNVDKIKDTDIIEIGFKQFDSKKTELVNSGIILEGNKLPSQDLEPGDIAVEENSRFAYISFTKNNAIAKLDLRKMGIEKLSSIKTKNKSGNSDSFALPEEIKTLNHNGEVYLLTANKDSSMTILKDGKNGLEEIFDSAATLNKVLKGIYPNGLLSSILSRNSEKSSFDNYIEIGNLRSRTYAFMALGTLGGIAVFDITDPQAAILESFIGMDNRTPIAKPLFINSQFELKNQPILLLPGIDGQESEVYELKFN
ncbi:MAG: hypothetical protein QMB63_03425 [Clostridiaceae bacterium]